MKISQIAGALLTVSLLFAGCQTTTNNSVKESENNTAASTEQTDSANKESEQNQPASQSQNPQPETDTAQSSESETDNPAPDQPAVVSEEERAASLSGELVQAFRNLGAETSPVMYQFSQSGNAEADFSADAKGGELEVYLTAAREGNNAKATFDANTANDESQSMSVMDEWTENGKTVRVVRNNMANANYVEVLDENTNTAIHIEDSLPEQLTFVLQALKNIGYPAEI